MKKTYCSLHGVWTVIVESRYVGPTMEVLDMER